MLLLLIKKAASNYKLNSGLLELLSEGFIIQKGRYFLKALHEYQSHINDTDFTDDTGYECFINSIHFDDYVSNDVFEQALLFSENLIKVWNAQNNGLVLMLVLSETDFGFNLKFHLYREEENWINENDIDKFEEALIVFNSSL
jgi:hypothetical protein